MFISNSKRIEGFYVYFFLSDMTLKFKRSYLFHLLSNGSDGSVAVIDREGFFVVFGFLFFGHSLWIQILQIRSFGDYQAATVRTEELSEDNLVLLQTPCYQVSTNHSFKELLYICSAALHC